MPRGGDAGGGTKGSSIQYSKPQEPSFLRDLKRRVGYKDPVEDMNAKRKAAEGLDNNQEDKDDEKPTVVVLNDGDLSEEEAQKIKAVQAEHKETGPVDGKILFKKPTKRKSEGEQDSKDKSTAKQKKKKEITTKPNLLSFNDEEDEHA